VIPLVADWVDRRDGVIVAVADRVRLTGRWWWPSCCGRELLFPMVGLVAEVGLTRVGVQPSARPSGDSGVLGERGWGDVLGSVGRG